MVRSDIDIAGEASCQLDRANHNGSLVLSFGDTDVRRDSLGSGVFAPKRGEQLAILSVQCSCDNSWLQCERGENFVRCSGVSEGHRCDAVRARDVRERSKILGHHVEHVAGIVDVIRARREQDRSGRCPHQDREQLGAKTELGGHCGESVRLPAERTLRLSARSLELTRRRAVNAAEVSTSKRTLRFSTSSPITPPNVVKSSPSPMVRTPAAAAAARMWRSFFESRSTTNTARAPASDSSHRARRTTTAWSPIVLAMRKCCTASGVSPSPMMQTTKDSPAPVVAADGHSTNFRKL